jgi:hypothetical protein
MEMQMAQVDIDLEYRDGFIEGFRSTRSEAVAEPEVPTTPTIPNGKKAYDIGWHDGRLHGLNATVPDSPVP